MLEFETLALEEAAPHVLIVRLNRPEVANALNTRMGRDLLALWTALTEDSRGLRCVVFSATGGRAFCAGDTWLTPSGITVPQSPSNAP
jgi:enoyl-CoA hydratase/carnithine racemase